MALDIAGAVNTVVELLKSAGVMASADIEKVNLPGAFVYASSVSHEYLSGAGSVRVEIVLACGNKGMLTSLSTLSDLLDKALTVIDPDADTQLSERIQFPQYSGGDLPAFRVSVDMPTS